MNVNVTCATCCDSIHIEHANHRRTRGFLCDGCYFKSLRNRLALRFLLAVLGYTFLVHG